MHTAHVATVMRILSAAERQGFSAPEVLGRAQVGDAAPLILNADLSDVRREHWLALDSVVKVWNYAARTLTRRRLLEDLLRALPVAELGPLGFAMLTADSLGASLAQVVRYFAVITTHGQWLRRDTPRQVSLVWRRVARSPGQCLANEAIFAHLVDMLEQLAGAAVVPVRVAMQHEAQPSSGALSALMPVRVEYSARENELIFDRETLSARPRQANAAIATYFERRLSEQLSFAHSRQSPLDSLRAELRREVTLRRESLDAASDRLKVSRRTLQRRLEVSNTTFSLELERARRERAHDLVTTTRRPLAQIALELGFADASTFARAFRRWYGAAPSEVRRVRS